MGYSVGYISSCISLQLARGALRWLASVRQLNCSLHSFVLGTAGESTRLSTSAHGPAIYIFINCRGCIAKLVVVVCEFEAMDTISRWGQGSIWEEHSRLRSFGFVLATL